jgi:phage terminase large subunit
MVQTRNSPKVPLDTSRVPGQRRFMESLSPELLYSGAFGAGKSRIGCEKGHFLSLRYPGNRGLIARKKFTDLRDTTMDTYFRYVCPPEHIDQYFKQEHKLVLKNGSEILFIGLDQFTKVGSLELGWAFLDELIEFTEEDWNMIQGRMRHPVPFQQVMAATNPAAPTHWVYSHFFSRPTKDVEAIESNSLDNPFTPPQYKQRLQNFRGKYYERFVEGKWISFEGLVYDNWDPSRHIIPPTQDIVSAAGHSYRLTGDKDNPIPEDWDHYRAIDFGFTNPFVCLWIASPRHRYIGEPGKQDRQLVPFDERLWIIYKQLYMSGMTIDDHALEIQRGTKTKILGSVADWDAGDRALLEKAGIPTIRASKEISSGIQTLYQTISEDRLYVLEDSLVKIDYSLQLNNKPTCLEEEFPLYVRQAGKKGIRDPKEDPAKANDHALDALRYILHTLNLSYKAGGQISIGNSQESLSQQSRYASMNSTPRVYASQPRRWSGMR